MYLIEDNFLKNKTIRFFRIQKNRWFNQANNFLLRVIFSFIYRCKNSIVKSLKILIKHGGYNLQENSNFLHLFFKKRIYRLIDTPNLVVIRLDATGIRLSSSMQREPRKTKKDKERHSSATQEILSHLSIHRFSLIVKLEELLCHKN